MGAIKETISAEEARKAANDIDRLIRQLYAKGLGRTNLEKLRDTIYKLTRTVKLFIDAHDTKVETSNEEDSSHEAQKGQDL